VANGKTRTKAEDTSYSSPRDLEVEPKGNASITRKHFNRSLPFALQFDGVLYNRNLKVLISFISPLP